MAVRFKFRSSASFDSVVIDGGRPSISVRDLKSKIVRCKNLDICRDFDLLLSDAVSGQEYYDEDYQIPSGSSVIIKRVPAGSARSDLGCVGSIDNVEFKDRNVVKPSPPVNVEIDNFDDFGDELCPVLEATISGSVFDVDKRPNVSGKKINVEVPRCFEKPSVGCVKLVPSDLSVAAPGASTSGPLAVGDEENMLSTKSKPCVAEHTKLDNVITGNHEALQNSDLPSELKCSLCDAFFKEAVMIPCCQHSFCEKCIHQVLVQNGRCPKCLSTKPRVEDLLPNVSLRQAIDRFLKSQIIIRGPENALDQYAPDGESGIQAKEMSCAVAIHQRQEELHHSPSATDRGSNQIISEPAGDRLAYLSCKPRETDGRRHGLVHPTYFKGQPEDFVTDFQGENQPRHGEAESTFTKKRALWVNTTGEERSFGETGWYRKGGRACYMCGSPDHLMRDCPAALSPHPAFPTGAMPGYAPHCWNGIPFPQFQPFGSPYGNPGVMPFHAVLVPAATFTVPTFMPSMLGAMPTCSGIARIGGAPVGTNAPAPWDRGHSEFRKLQGCEKIQKLSNDNLKRGQSSYNEEDRGLNKHHNDKADRASYNNSDRQREESVSYLESLHRKRQRHSYLPDDIERSGSEVEDVPCSSKWHGEKRHKSHQKNAEKHNHQREKHGSDSGPTYLCRNEVKEVKRKQVRSDSRRDLQKHHSQSDSLLEPSHEEKGSSHGSGHLRHHSRSVNEGLSYERWQMFGGSEEDGDDDFYYNKLKRAY